MTPGEKLKQLREQHDLSLKEMSKLLHTTPRTLSGWERGQRKASIYAYMKCTELFDIGLSYFYTDN
ncbi:helix-turn-helix domain-containing protein [Sporolactobacillus shoreicorticis]|uniref:Helix-turn-helix domain-containing protein n=1 Tax=Sporolactobacillus shoreicorticis TaxID=1923877 RepID=A0ABW5S7G3_9BACL